MRPIQSIICFNPGSAGDLLKALCIENSQYKLESHGGILIKNQYFKIISKEIYYQSAACHDIDLELLCPVENTHFYIDFYHKIANKIYYINYPTHLQAEILNTVKHKRYHDDWNEFITWHLYSVPDKLKKYVSVETAADVFNIMWLKNLRGWQNNNNLIPIELCDFFDYYKMQNIVEQVSCKRIQNINDFNLTYYDWIKVNSKLAELFVNDKTNLDQDTK
jgi:hypothetical protein